jgi:hypothetical protein
MFGPDGGEMDPRPGDLAVCASCFNVMEFESGGFRTLSERTRRRYPNLLKTVEKEKERHRIILGKLN